MWRVFHWLDGYAPSFFKFSLMSAALAAAVAGSILLGQLHPMMGIAFGFGLFFALWRGSIDYRFNKKAKEKPPSTQTIGEASEDEVLRRVRRAANTALIRRMILAKALEDSPDGETARAVIERWRAAETHAAKTRLRKAFDRLSFDASARALAERGIEKMSGEQALERARELEQALDDLPRATEGLRSALDAQLGENGKPRS